MALKIDTNQSATAHHIFDGPKLFPYAIDAQSAITRFPLEWRAEPWTKADADAARSELVAQREREIEDAKARGQQPPPPMSLPEQPKLSPEDQAAVDEHDRAVAEANERLKARREKLAAERAEADQAAQDEALVNSSPPRPDSTVRKPMTPAQHRKFQANRVDGETDEQRIEREDRERIQAEKINADKTGTL